jgi:hypothetical protein
MVPQDPKRIPRFPVILLDDIPFLMVTGYSLQGSAEPVEMHVEYFRKNGKLRLKMLRPSDSPMRVFRQFQNSFLWAYGDTRRSRSRGETIIMTQLLRLVRTVYHRETDFEGTTLIAREGLVGQWDEIVDAVAQLNCRWDNGKNCFTFKDGSTLPEPLVKRYRREIWELRGAKYDARLILKRADHQRVYVILNWSGSVPEGDQPNPWAIRVYAIKARHIPLAELIIPSRGFEGKSLTSTQSSEFKLLEGEQLQVELSTGKEVTTSPVYQP